MFEKQEPDLPRLPPRASGRFWVAGGIVSAVLHVAILVLLMDSVHDGDPIAVPRPSGTSSLVAQIALLDASEPAPAPISSAAQPQRPEGAPSTFANASISAPAVSAVISQHSSASPENGATAPGGASSVASVATPLVDLASLGSDYRRRLLEHIAAHRLSPPAGAPSGTAYVDFSLIRNGDVQSVAIAVSSGDATLDRAAVESIRDADPMPMIPPGFPDHLKIMLPVDFRQIEPAKVLARP